MVGMDINRPQTEVEKREMTLVGAKTGTEIFLAKLAEVGQKFVKAHKPFDEQCAKFDFQDEIDRVERESVRIYGFVRPEDINKMEFKDLEKYGNMDRFDLIRVDEETEMQVVTVGGRNAQKNVTVGYTVMYKCKERGHGCSVYMTVDEYEKQFGEKKEKEKEEK